MRRSFHGRWQRGGNASNICTVLAQYGVRSEFLGILPVDKIFDVITEDFRNRNISIANCVFSECNVPLRTVFINGQSGSTTAIFSNENIGPLTLAHFKRIDLDEYRWLHFEVSSV